MGNQVTDTNVKKHPRLGTKILIFIALLVISLVGAGCVLVSIYDYMEGYYYKSLPQVLIDAWKEYVPDDGHFYITSYVKGETTLMDYHAEQENIAFVTVARKNRPAGSSAYYSYGDRSYADTALYSFFYEEEIDGAEYVCRIVLGYDLMKSDNYRAIFLLNNTLYSLRYAVYPIGVIAGILWLWLLILLVLHAGYAHGESEPKKCFESKIPLEIHLCFFAGLVMLIGAAMDAGADSFRGFLPVAGIVLGGGLLIEIVVLLWVIFFAIRIRTGNVWSTSLVRRCLAWLWKLCRKAGEGIRTFWLGIPLIWQVLVAFGAAAFGLFCCMALASRRYEDYKILGWTGFFLLLIVLLALTVHTALSYRMIYDRTVRISKGELDAPEVVPSESAEGAVGKLAKVKQAILSRDRMLPIFKKHDKLLDTISGGIVLNNEKRLASEKTQSALITNVSHDIKTPLTSIINYADLITKEPCENEKIAEYAEVLGRQSTRLKRLLEDLIEVSKAQSGAMEVELSPCVAGTFLSQAAGEYEEKLEQANLSLVVKNADSEAKILADPRRMWRVFDNLLGNICKYSQPGTRVYLSLEESPATCRIVFKNTSARELDLTPQELMERFVRGDKSRNGAEGNGLGLSIAASLTELQKGEMELGIDGDLFKVTLTFPKLA